MPIFQVLDIRIESLGCNPTEEQQLALLEWIVKNIGRDHWRSIAEYPTLATFTTTVGELYERSAEWGQ